jgi:hypothetical protein
MLTHFDAILTPLKVLFHGSIFLMRRSVVSQAGPLTAQALQPYLKRFSWISIWVFMKLRCAMTSIDVDISRSVVPLP